VKKHSKAKSRPTTLKKQFKARDRVRTARGSALQHTSPSEHASGLLPDDDVLELIEGHNHSGLSQAKAQWLFGDWDTLARVNVDALRNNPDRDRFVLLAAAAHHQLGRHDDARKLIRLALKWGCPPRLVAQILAAGVHNTLGRTSALARDNTRAMHHFRNAVAIVSAPRETELLGHARSVTVIAADRKQARTIMRSKARQISERPEHTRARISVLETELELLHHELSLAQQRQQLFTRQADGKSAPVSPDDAGWIEMLEKKAVSQLGQDLWVLKQTGYKRGGFFVEFGATDGVLLSNTWLLEKEFGWRGICAEPNPKFFERLGKNRNCTVSDACIGSETGKEIEFIFADAYGGIADHAGADLHAGKRAAYGEIGVRAKFITISLHDFLKRHDAPRQIDYLSIDTEGSEWEILRSFPFSEWQIDLLTVEHNFTPQREQIRALLSGLGYRFVEREWEDWFYLNAGSKNEQSS